MLKRVRFLALERPSQVHPLIPQLSIPNTSLFPRPSPNQVAAGLECGVGVDDFNEWQAGDSIEAFELVKRARSLEDASKEASKAVADRSSALGLGVAV